MDTFHFLRNPSEDFSMGMGGVWPWKNFRWGLPAFLLLLCIGPLSGAPHESERVSFKTNDGRPLVAFFKKPQKNQPTVLMLHGLASTKEEWLPMAALLDQHGWGWLLYDARGHGESSLTKGKDGSPDGYRYFRPPGPGSDWEKMVDDVGAALSYLQKTHAVERSSIYLMGASLGANVGLKYASLTKSVKKVVLLSPGLNYQEIRAEEALGKMRGESVLMVAHPSDRYAFASSRKLKESSPKSELWTDVNPGHGVQMFDGALMGRIVEWLGR